MDIYSILSSKPHNPHYLNRYITFIEQCQQKNVGCEGYVEKHHICPKADDMFPEYKDFRNHPWNKALLTTRQHFIAHMILWKTFSVYSQIIAFNLMVPNDHQKSSRIYRKLREDYYSELEKMKPVMSERATARVKRMLDDGSHPFLQESLIEKSRERMKKDNPMTKMRINKGSFKKGHKPVITKETKKKMSLSKMGDKNPNYGKPITEEQKKKLSEITSRKRWISNEIETIYVNVDLLDEYLSKGYEMGRKFTKSRKENR